MVESSETEFLRAGGSPVLKQLQRIFNFVLHEGRTSQAWSRSMVVLFFKKGDKTLLKNYCPISLLSHDYKLFSRVIASRLMRWLYDFQPYSIIIRLCVSHLWTMRWPLALSRPRLFSTPRSDAKFMC